MIHTDIRESAHDTVVADSTIVDILRWRAESEPNRVAFTFLRHEEEEQKLSYLELDQRARSVALFLQRAGMAGERALLLLPTGEEYVAAFFGCLYAGVVAIPGFPVHPGRTHRGNSWFRAVYEDARPRVIFCLDSDLSTFKDKALLREILWVTPECFSATAADGSALPSVIDPGALAFLQYTSGSTSSPKGVMVNHGNIISNQRVIQETCEHDRDSTVVSWVPLHHDMGLVGTVLQPVYLGAQSILMPPSRFLREPGSWLRAISKYRGHSSCAPNFAYELCCQKISAGDREQLDLSSWTTAINGAEPIRFDTMERFASQFASCGFDIRRFRPSYGLAESTLMVSGRYRSDELIARNFSPSELEQNIVELAPEGAPSVTLVSCGRPAAGTTVEIVDPHTMMVCPAGAIGEIWVTSPSVAHGYWNKATESNITFRAWIEGEKREERRYLRTGDLGFLLEGELFVTGRIKDLIIIRGRNLYAQDVEFAVQQGHPTVQGRPSAAFTIEHNGEPALVVVSEFDRHQSELAVEAIEAIRSEVTTQFGVRLHAVALVNRGGVPRTTSGKIRRNACRKLFLANGLEPVSLEVTPEQMNPGADHLYAGYRAALLEAPPELRPELFRQQLSEHLKRLLHASTSEIDSTVPLVRLGLDSMGAVEIQHLVECLAGKKQQDVPMIQEATIDSLVAAVLEDLDANAEGSFAHSQEEDMGGYPLSYGQHGLWIANQIAPDSGAYNLAGAIRLKGSPNLELLEKAFQSVQSKHEMLRMTFSSGPDGVMQIPLSPDDDRLKNIIKRRRIPKGEAALREALNEEVRRPFVLGQQPAVRMTLLEIDDERPVVILAFHHILTDLWSMGLLLREIGEAYSTGAKGELVPERPSPAATYREFVREQRRRIPGAEGEKHWDFWRARLAGDQTPLQLPWDRPRPALQSFRGAAYSFSLPASLSDQVNEIARAHGTTFFTILLSALQVLLHRLSGQNDLCIGTPVHGRSENRFAEEIGYFVNTVVLRSIYDESLTFAEYLEKTKEIVTEALLHQDYPFALLMERLRPQRDRSVHPLFQAMFAWQKGSALGSESASEMSLGQAGLSMRLGALEGESIAIETDSAQFDLTLMMTQTESGLAGVWKYSVDLFEEATVRRFAQQFVTLLEAIAENPSRRLSELRLFSPQEREDALRRWSSPASAPASVRMIVSAEFEALAARTPTAIALIAGGVEYTYAQLNARANQFARHLHGLGVGAEIRVGLCLPRGMHMVAAILGIWKAGAAYVPIDPFDPKARIAAVVEQSSMQLLITDEQWLGQLPESLPQLVLLDLDLEQILEEEETNPGFEIHPSSLAYIIFTSGTTGVPKGSMIEHRSLRNLRAALQKEVYGEQSAFQIRVSLNAPITFDSSVKQLLVLTMGHSLCLVPDEIRRDGAATLQFIAEQGLQVFDCTPTQMQLLMDAGFEPKSNRTTFLLGGENIAPSIWAQLCASRSAQCFNLYGPTECTVDATLGRIAGDLKPSIGVPLPNVHIYLLDQHLEPLPVGVPGEIFIAGEGVGRGYSASPSLTAERFLPDVFAQNAGLRMYRTGDRARYLPDGRLEFIDRLDRQAKIRGFRVELREVEVALCAYPGVEDAAVVVRQKEDGARQLVGYVTSGDRLSSTEYRRYLSQRLPEYMVPAVVVTIPEFPRNANGKKDYTLLPVPEVVVIEHGENYMSARSELEHYLVQIWTDTLRVEPIGINDNFFTLGGDSLQATRLITRIQEKYPTSTPLLSSFFQDPTIAALSAAIDADS